MADPAAPLGRTEPVPARDAAVAAAAAAPALPAWRRHLADDWTFTRRTLIVIGLVSLTYILWSVSYALLLVFGASLFAIVLRAFADTLHRWLRVPHRWSLATALVLIGLAVIGLGILFGAQMRGQLNALTERLPTALDDLGRAFGIAGLSEHVNDMVGGSGGSILRRVAGLGYTALNGLTDAALVFVAAIYLAIDPGLYRRGLVKLFPVNQHPRIEDLLQSVGNGLRLWFGAQLIDMAFVALISMAAYWFIGLPGALALGLIAGITNFIPLIGPLIGAVPAVLIAFSVDLQTVLWTLGAALLIQQIEGNVILPIVQRRAADLPPALALFAIVAAGLLFGLPGVVLGVPLSMAIYIAVKKLYVRQTLGENTPVPGEQEGPAPGTPAAAS